MRKPRVEIVGGPPGSGKSSVFMTNPSLKGLITIDLDRICLELADNDWSRVLDTDIRSRGRELREELITKCLSNGTSFVIEKVLDSESYLELILLAREHGFETRLSFVCPRDAMTCFRRVSARSQSGSGHFVPEAELEELFEKSTQNALRAIMHFDHVLIYENQDSLRELGAWSYGEREDGIPVVDSPSWFQFMEASISVSELEPPGAK